MLSAKPTGCTSRLTRLDDPRDLTEAFDGVRTVFMAIGSVGIEGVLQRIAINAAAGISFIEQVIRLSVLNASADSLGINQRAHHSIDQFAASTEVPYSTIRPAIFSALLLAAAPEVRGSRTWTGLARSGRMANIDHRDVAAAGLRVLTDPALWGAHHDLTGPVPMSWPEALELLSAELGEPVTFRVAGDRQFLESLTRAGVPAGTAQLLIAREWATLAGENDHTTDTFRQITRRRVALGRRVPSSSTCRRLSSHVLVVFLGDEDPPGRPSLTPFHGKARVCSRPPIASVAGGSAWPGDQPHRTSVPQCSPGPSADCDLIIRCG